MSESENIIWTGRLSRFENGSSSAVAVRLTGRVLQIRKIVSGSTSNSSIPSTNSQTSIPNGTFETFWLNEIVSCDRITFEDAVNDDNERNSGKCCSSGSKKSDSQQQKHSPTDMCLRFVIYATRTSESRKAHRQILHILGSVVPSENGQDLQVNSGSSLSSLYAEIEPLISSDVHSQKPLLIFINPNSGKGKAIRLFDKRVRAILEDCKVKHQIFITKHSGHAFEYVRETPDIAEHFSALCVLSGDGLLWEAINGFVSTVEQQNADLRAIPLPIGIIPGGSGNGLAHSLNSFYYRGGKSSDALVDNTLHVAKGQAVAMDLMRFSCSSKIYYAFLSFGWGLMSDIDIESERLRFLGEARFTIWSLYRSANTKKYAGTLSYLPVDKTNSSVPNLESPLNSDWVTVNGPFITVYASIQPFLSQKVQFAPDSRLDDSIIYLLYIREGVSALKIVQFLVSLEECTHVKLPYVNFIPVRAFRLVPNGTPSDIMAIDGERIESQPIQAEIMSRAAPILIRP